jgi:hypothetical protein
MWLLLLLVLVLLLALECFAEAPLLPLLGVNTRCYDFGRMGEGGGWCCNRLSRLLSEEAPPLFCLAACSPQYAQPLCLLLLCLLLLCLGLHALWLRVLWLHALWL